MADLILEKQPSYVKVSSLSHPEKLRQLDKFNQHMTSSLLLLRQGQGNNLRFTVFMIRFCGNQHFHLLLLFFKKIWVTFTMEENRKSINVKILTDSKV